MERLEERIVRHHHASVSTQNQQGLLHGFHDRPAEIPAALPLLEAELQAVDLEQHHDEPFDPVVLGPVGAQAHRVPNIQTILNLDLLGGQGFEHLGGHVLEVREPEGMPDLGDVPSDIRGRQAHHRVRCDGGSPQPQIACQHHDRHVDARDQVGQIVADLRQVSIPNRELVVDRGQLFVGRLELLMRGLQLFVGALELLHARHELLVRRLELLLGRLPAVHQQSQVLLAVGQLVSEPD